MEQPHETLRTTGRELATRLFSLVAGDQADSHEPVRVNLGDGSGHFLADPTTINGPDTNGAINDTLSVGGTHITAEGIEAPGTLTFGVGNHQDHLTAAHFTPTPVEN